MPSAPAQITPLDRALRRPSTDEHCPPAPPVDGGDGITRPEWGAAPAQDYLRTTAHKNIDSSPPSAHTLDEWRLNRETTQTYLEDAPKDIQALLLEELDEVSFTAPRVFLREWPTELIASAIEERKEAEAAGAKIRNPAGLIRWHVTTEADAFGIARRTASSAPRSKRSRKKTRPFQVERQVQQKSEGSTYGHAERAS